MRAGATPPCGSVAFFPATPFCSYPIRAARETNRVAVVDGPGRGRAVVMNAGREHDAAVAVLEELALIADRRHRHDGACDGGHLGRMHSVRPAASGSDGLADHPAADLVETAFDAAHHAADAFVTNAHRATRREPAAEPA